MYVHPDQTAPKSSQIQAYTEVNNTAPDRNAQHRASQSGPVPFTMTHTTENPGFSEKLRQSHSVTHEPLFQTNETTSRKHAYIILTPLNPTFI